MRLWTLKEAYVKAVGRGIGARPGLRGFSVSLDHTDASEERSRLHLTSAAPVLLQKLACQISLASWYSAC